MTRSLFRLPFAELSAIAGIGFGAWLIHNTFQPSADTPNYLLLAIGALDILLCFGLLAFLLRARLREGEALPKSWIVAGALLLACFLGWIAALFFDSDRLLALQQQHGALLKDLARLDDSLQHLGDATPDRKTWQGNYDQFAGVQQQLHLSLRSHPAWDKEVTRIDDEVQQLHKLVNLILTETSIEQRNKWHSDFKQAHQRAVSRARELRQEIARAEHDLGVAYRARWHAVGAAALTAVVLVLGCLLFWLLFDRELRRSLKAQVRLAGNEARFRWLVETQSEPIAVLDTAGGILYVNPVWESAFGYVLDELQDANLFALIHADDRPRVLASLRSSSAVPCRLKADYGVWHDVELQCQPHDDAGTLVVRVHDVRETPDVPMLPQPELLNSDSRLAEMEQEHEALRAREAKVAGDLEQQRWLLDAHREANADGVLILSARGEPISWNPAFVRLWKLSEDTMAGHTWPTIAAHMESQVESGWDDFAGASAPAALRADSCWEMTLEGVRTFEVYAQAISPRLPGENVGAMQFLFRDVTRQKDLLTQLRDHRAQLGEHEQRKESYESDLREHGKRVKQLEKQLRQRDQDREEMETTLRDHQDRLHQMHERHESHETSLKQAGEAMRRLASGVANDVNNVLSVVLGNAEVLRDNLPPDHVAQNYLTDIHDAAGKGTELTQRLLAFSRNHLLQPVPVEINKQLASLEPKLRVALGHVQLQWQRGAAELWAKADARPLEQALVNLATHARSRMPDGGTLTIRTSRVQLSQNELTHADLKPGAYVQVQLLDTGALIDDDKLTHVFEPYLPLVAGQKGDLSLATAQGILRQSGGCIDVASEKGHGAEWTILLPETNERQQAALRASA